MPSIKYKEKTYAGASFPCLEVTKAEYDALSEEKKMDGTVYMIPDGTGGWEAENVSYDNTESGLTEGNVQDVIDELYSKTAFGRFDARSDYSSFSALPNKAGLFRVHYPEDSSTKTDSPEPGVTGFQWWNVIQLGSPTRITQIAMNVYAHNSTVYYRKKHDNTWYGWYSLSGPYLKTDDFVTQTYTEIYPIGPSVVNWSIYGAKVGYTAKSYTFFHSNCTTVKAGVEGVGLYNSSFNISGFARTIDGSTAATTAFWAQVLWVKNV